MSNSGMTGESHDMRGFVSKHKSAVVVFVIGAILAVVGAVYVFWWFSGYAQSTNLAPTRLILWTMGDLVAYMVNLVFWELVFIGIPVVVAGLIAWQWWKRLPEEERRAYRFRKGPRGVGGGFSLVFFIAFAIKVYLDGNWNVPISTWTLDYVVGSTITVFVWLAVLFGIPAAIAATWWFSRRPKAQPAAMSS